MKIWKLKRPSLANLIFLYFDFFKLTKLIICAVHLIFNTSVKSLMVHGTSVEHHQLFPVIPVWPGGVPGFMKILVSFWPDEFFNLETPPNCIRMTGDGARMRSTAPAMYTPLNLVVRPNKREWKLFVLYINTCQVYSLDKNTLDKKPTKK